MKRKKNWENLRFWRTVLKNEVDFIWLGQDQEPLPYEAKLTVPQPLKIPAGLRSFMRLYQPRQAYVVNLALFGKRNYQKTKIKFLPAWSL